MTTKSTKNSTNSKPSKGKENISPVDEEAKEPSSQVLFKETHVSGSV